MSILSEQTVLLLITDLLTIGQLDELLSEAPNTHLITCPVFGPPVAADKAQLVIIMSGDYRSKKEVAYLLVPAVGRKVIDLGGNLQKGMTICTALTSWLANLTFSLQRQL